MSDVAGRRLGVLISGRGSNLQSIIDAIDRRELDATIAVVISNVSDAYGLHRARAAGIEAIVLPHQQWPTREQYDQALAGELCARQVDWICLAGFMRLLSRSMVEAFPNRILNIHPSLLPAFPGLDAQRQAFAYGVKVAGATVHLVAAELDGGPIVLQGTVPVLDSDTADTLAGRILEEEHRLYPQAIRLLLDGGFRVEGRRVVFGRDRHRAAGDR